MMKTVTVEPYGQFTYATDVYQKYMESTQKELVAMFLSEELNSRHELPRYKVTKMRKADLAAHLADWWRVCYEAANEKAAPVQRIHINLVTCSCGELVETLDNGTMARHTRHNIVARRAEINSGQAPRRVRCRWSGKFPPSVVAMRAQTNARDAANHSNEMAQGIKRDEVTYTYRHVQVPDARKVNKKVNVRTGTRRSRRDCTKNIHRTVFGKRFQVGA